MRVVPVAAPLLLPLERAGNAELPLPTPEEIVGRLGAVLGRGAGGAADAWACGRSGAGRAIEWVVGLAAAVLAVTPAAT